MFAILPWRTDAPVYYFPIVTLSLIALNIVHALGFFGPSTGFWSLHLLTLGMGIFELMTLWTFGMVVEGKVGWIKFLLMYLSFFSLEVFGHSFIEPLEGLAWMNAGSATLFALIGVALVWAPENEIHFLYVSRFMYRGHGGSSEMRIVNVAIFCALILLLFAYLAGTFRSSAMLSLALGSIGFAVGVAMLKADMVDCERWDLFSVLAGKKGQPDKPGIRIRTRRLDGGEGISEAKRGRSSLKQLRTSLAQGDLQGAHEAYTNLKPSDPLKEADLRRLIRGLQEQGDHVDSIPLMNDYIQRFPRKASKMRLKAAETLIKHAQRPKQALRVLARVRERELSAPLAAAYQRLTEQALAKQAEVIEFETEDW